MPQTAAPKVMAIFARLSKTRILGISAKGEPREIFKNSTKKVALVQRPINTLAKMVLSNI